MPPPETALDPADLPERARAVLGAHWVPELGWTVPNPGTYPHLWLWDSAFHSIAWARLGDARAVPELRAVLEGQLADGMVPHMRYGPAGPDTFLGPLPDRSSLTQPPLFGHAIAELRRGGIAVPADLLDRATAAYAWLWEARRDAGTGLLRIVHPWEAGNDHAPRWDGWGAPGTTRHDYDQAVRSGWNKELMGSLRFAADGAAVASDRFECAPAGFNAYAAFAMRELAEVTGDEVLAGRADDLAAAIDAHLWGDGQWVDRALVGGDGRSVGVRISDGLMPALVTGDGARARAALAGLADPRLFGGTPFGPTNVARCEPAYDPAAYWRGAAWPNVSYLLWLAARRWGLDDLAADVARTTRAGAVASGWAEYWDPETGRGHGAAPQSWTSLVAAMA